MIKRVFGSRARRFDIAGSGFFDGVIEALQALFPFVFERLNLHRIEAACLPHNAASRSLLCKVGFREEGHARQYLRINGDWQDHVLYALLRGDLRDGA